MKKLIIAGFMVAANLMATAQEHVVLSWPFGIQLFLFMGFIAIACGIIGSAYGMAISLSAYAGCEKDRRALAFIPAIMPGTQGIYAVAILCMMTQTMIAAPFHAACAGTICGITSFLSAISQAKIAASCIKAINHGVMEQGQAITTTGIVELYAVLGFAAAFLVML